MTGDAGGARPRRNGNGNGEPPQPPVITFVNLDRATPGTAVEIWGEDFGGPGLGRVLFQLDLPGAAAAEAAVPSWGGAPLIAEVPPLAALGSGGPALIVVETEAGTSNPASFVVLEPEPPAVTRVAPAEALPGDDLRISGRGFGLARFGGVVVFIRPDGGEIAAEVLSWGANELRVDLPPLGALGGSGPRQLRVRTLWGASEPSTVVVGEQPSLSPLPVLLLPVRLETRYADDGAVLRVRVFPDDCAVDSHEPPLTAEERARASGYRAASPADREALWRELVARFGAGRAAWLAQAPTGPADPGTRDGAWTRAPRTRVMPSRWYVLGYKGTTRVLLAWGRDIPDELAVGPDPRTFGVSVPGDGAPVDQGMRWMVDFQAALENGMALQITLPPEARGRLDRLVVLGVKTIPDGLGAEDRIAELLTAHRYTRGLGFLEEGTPTNNTGTDRAGFDSTAAPPPVLPGEPSFTPNDGSNRSQAAAALGLAERVLASVAGADGGQATDQGRRAMNTVLWPATWGYYLEQLMAPLPDAATIDAVRVHFQGWVRACGPLPVLRVGNQPYGLLVATPLERWQPREADAPAGLVGLLNRARGLWRASHEQVPRIGRPGANDDQNLLAVLAMRPTSVSYRARSVLGAQYVSAGWRFMRQGLPPSWWQAASDQPRRLLDELGITGRPRLERATFASSWFSIGGPAVEADPPGNGTAALRANYLEWLSRPNRPGYRSIRDESFPEISQLPAPRPLLYLLVRHGLLLEYLGAASRLAPFDGASGREEELVGMDELDDDLAAPRPPTPWDRLAFGAKGRWLDANDTPNLGAFRASLRTLAALPVRTLERLLAETLDLCSYRLDAWATSIATRRLDAVRRDQANGLHLAGWGAVLDLEPDTAAGGDSRGYVHAPSLTHATTAAILASGYLTHQPEAGRHPLAIDLSAARVRLALWLIAGVRQGQPLGGLLGYRFERGLHERGRDRYLDEFRAFAPLPTAAAGSAVGPPSGVAGSLAATNITDGLELQRRWSAVGRRLGADGWPAVQPEHQADVAAELAALDDAVDALGDALLAEGVFQAARGNPARAAAAVDAASGTGSPPAEIEVAQTPRSGLGVTHRLLLLLPEGPLPDSDWDAEPPAAPSPRATAEPRLEAWAAQLLGAPERVVADVEYVDRDGGQVLATSRLRLHELSPRLSALDVVYAAEAHDRPQLSELEQRFLFHAERNRPTGTPPDAAVRLTAGPPPADEQELRLSDLLEVARAARAAIAGARPLAGADLAAPELSTSATPRLQDIEDRARLAVDALDQAERSLRAAIGGGSEDLRSALLAAAQFGIPGAVPTSAVGDLDADRAALRAQAGPMLSELTRRVLQAAALPAATSPEARHGRALALMATVFGRGFRTLPLLSPDGTSDPMRLDVQFGDSTTLTGGDPLVAATWLQRAARVRDGARRLVDVLTYAAAIGGRDTLQLAVAQLPTRTGDRWIALPFEDPSDPPAGRLSFAALLPFGTPAAGQAVGGLLLDEWVEVVPSGQETTAVAFHFDRPNASAPQTMILAVPPRPEPWTLGTLEATVLQTLELAQSRMVDLDALQRAGHLLPATHLAVNLRGATVASDLKGGTGWPVT